MKNQPLTIKPPTILVALGLIALALVFTATRAFPVAKQYITNYTPDSLTNIPTSVAASSTSSGYTEWVDVRRQPSLFVQITAALVATNPGAATLTRPIYRSIDGVTAEETAYTTLSITMNGTQTKNWATNINLGDAGWLKFGEWTTTATNAVTNIAVRIASRPPRAVISPADMTP